MGGRREGGEGGIDRRDGEVPPRPGQSWNSGRWGGSVPQLQRRASPILGRRKENGDRWTIHRIEGAGRRLLDYPGEVAGRSDRVGEAVSGGGGPGDRNRSTRVY